MHALHRATGLLCLLLSTAAASRSPAQQAPRPNRRAAYETVRQYAVENALIPAVRVKGRPLPSMTLAARMRKYRVQGVSIAVINNYTIEWTKAYGVADAAGRTPADTGTLFQVGAAGQPISAALALRLAQSKKIDLDRDVNRSLKSWKIPKSDLTRNHPVTARALLAHSAGLTATTAPGYPADAPIPTLTQVLSGSRPARTPAITVQQTPGQEFRSSAGDYVVLEQLLLDVAKRPFPDLAAELVLGPLGMTRSTFQQPRGPPLKGAAAAGHDATGKPIEGWRVYPEQAAAGLWTTALDLARFALDVQLAAAGKPAKALSADAARQLLTTEHVGWPGLGVMVEGRDQSTRFRAAGATLGFESEMVAYVHRGQGAVVLTNTTGGGALIAEILNGIAKVYGWPDYVPPEKMIARVDPRVYDRFVGMYSADGRTVSVVRRGTRLLIGPRGKEVTELLPESVSDFFTTDSDALYSFVFDEHGKVQAFTLQRRNEYSRWDREVRGEK
ncbi:MAG: beta-lactamase family protein [Gemmatimonadetes bacterium]|nr:beta-lactamase family protein [Gemmatimonadota bacterium]